MIALKVTVRETFGKWLGGLGEAFTRKGAEVGREIFSEARPPPQDEAEQALWQAMGWDQPAGEDAGKITAKAVGELMVES